jgi:fructoselysine-6-P-deglycase FrlB-like protein
LIRKVIVSMANECRSDADLTMAREIREAPAAVSRQQEGLAEPLAELVGRLKRRPPQVVVTCARGSSAHAATFGKHLIERYIGIPVAEAAPNIASVYGRRRASRTSCFSPSRNREGATISSPWPRAPRRQVH